MLKELFHQLRTNAHKGLRPIFVTALVCHGIHCLTKVLKLRSEKLVFTRVYIETHVRLCNDVVDIKNSCLP